MTSTYLNKKFTDLIKGNINTVIECGSRDCLDAIAIYRYYTPKKIYSFECNPESIPVCENNIAHFPNIKLIKKAVSDVNGIVDFYATDMDSSIDKNIGASSLLLHRDQVKYIQKKIKVDSIRLDNFLSKKKIDKIDLLCMDLQGAEDKAIIGLGERLKDVRYIISEISKVSFYHNDINYRDLKTMLHNLGFDLAERDNKKTWGNALFINRWIS